MTDLVMLPPDELVPLLASRDANERRMAIYELEKTQDKRYSGDISPMLADGSHYVRMAAARALGELGDPAVAGDLMNALDDDYYMVVQNAVWSLAKLGAAGEKALPRLKEMATSDTVLRERQLSVAEVAQLAIDMIELEVEKKKEAEEAAKAAKAAQQQATAAAPGEEGAAPAAAAAAPAQRTANRPSKRQETLDRKRARANAEGADASWIPAQ